MNITGPEHYWWENNFKVYTLGPCTHRECRFWIFFFKKEGLEKEIHIFEKKKEIHIKKEENTHFIISLLKKEGNTHKKEGSIFFNFEIKEGFPWFKEETHTF